MKALAEKIEVMQAAEGGAEIEIVKVTGMGGDSFHSTDCPMFDWANFDYRIKKEPMEFWVNVYKDPKNNGYHLSKEAADIKGGLYSDYIKTIKVIEVIEC